jgi:hypothetical protein
VIRIKRSFATQSPGERTSSGYLGMSEKCGGLNRSTQHFIFEGQDGV